MKKRILNYLHLIDEKLLTYKNTPELITPQNINEDLKEHLIQISFFQHERFIHLIVTVLFAILTFASIFFTIATTNIAIFILTFFLLILLIPYIKHYYLLENGVQKMYEQYDVFYEYLQLYNKTKS